MFALVQGCKMCCYAAQMEHCSFQGTMTMSKDNISSIVRSLNLLKDAWSVRWLRSAHEGLPLPILVGPLLFAFKVLTNQLPAFGLLHARGGGGTDWATSNSM